jgi:hypothetical protein
VLTLAGELLGNAEVLLLFGAMLLLTLLLLLRPGAHTSWRAAGQC